MINGLTRRILATMVALAIVFLILPVAAFHVQAVTVSYTLDATTDLAAMAAGEKADGDTQVAGTGNYFTVIFSSKTKIDGSNKEFDDGYTAAQRLNFGGKCRCKSRRHEL